MTTMFQRILNLLISGTCVDPMVSHKVVQSDFKSREAHTRLMNELNKWKLCECGVKVVEVKSNDRRVQTL